MVTGKRVRAAREPGIQSCFEDLSFNVRFEFAELTAEQKVAVKKEHRFIYDPGQVPDNETMAVDTDDWMARFYGHAPLTSVIMTKPEKFLEDKEEFEDLTDRELKQVAFEGEEISLMSATGDHLLTRRFYAPNGKHFTVSELHKVVEKFETTVRQLDWEDGCLNPDHSFFEGFWQHSDDEGLYEIHWGS